MNAAQATVRTSDSTVRTPVLTATPRGPKAQLKQAASRVGSAARRVLDALMRSLAAPHV